MTVLLTDNMRAHFSDVSTVAGDHNILINDRLTNQAVSLICNLLLGSHGEIKFKVAGLLLSQMHSGFSLFIAAGPLLDFWHPIFWLDRMAAVFAEHATFG